MLVCRQLSVALTLVLCLRMGLLLTIPFGLTRPRTGPVKSAAGLEDGCLTGARIAPGQAASTAVVGRSGAGPLIGHRKTVEEAVRVHTLHSEPQILRSSARSAEDREHPMGRKERDL